MLSVGWTLPQGALYLCDQKRYKGDIMASATFEDIVETFEFLDGWEDRYRHVIEMGRALPAMDPALKTPATKVDGCASQVWLQPMIDGSGARCDL